MGERRLMDRAVRAWGGLCLCVLLLLAACGGGAGGTGTVPGSGPAQILEQPVDLSVQEGMPVTFTVKAVNARDYQWQRLVDGVWKEVSGQQGPSLKWPSALFGDSGGQFRVLVRGATETVTSAIVTLTVTRRAQAPAISVQPASQLLVDGEALSWSVTASGTDLVYQWQRSRDGISWIDVPGAMSAIWSAGTVTLADDGWRVRVLVSNPLGRITSAEAALQVQAAPALPTFALQPADAVLAQGQGLVLTAEVLGTPKPALQWQRSGDGIQWADVPQATAAQLQLPAPTPAEQGDRFRLRASNRAGEVFSRVARILMLPAGQSLVWLTEPQAQRVGIGDDAVFTAQVVGAAPAVVQWQFSQDGGTTWQTLAGALGGRLVVSAASRREDGRWYRAVASNESGVITSRPAQLQLEARLRMRVLLGDARGRGHRDGPRLDAKLDQVAALAQDSAGNLYFTDSASHVLRKIDFATGRVTTLAGSPYEPGSQDGIGAAARFRQPMGLAVGAQGQVYVADVLNERIRYVSPEGQVTTVAEFPKPNGRLLLPEAPLAVHPVTGELFYASYCGIYRVSASHPAVLWSGVLPCGASQDGDVTTARWEFIQRMRFDADGTLVVQDMSSLRRILPSGRVETMGPASVTPSVLDELQPRRASDGARYAAAAWPGQSIVYAYTPGADGRGPTLEWDEATGRFQGAELIAGALNMAVRPKSQTVKALRGFESLLGVAVGVDGRLWLSSPSFTQPELWQLERDGQQVLRSWPTSGVGFQAMLPLGDQVLHCQRTGTPDYSDQLLSRTADGTDRLLATWLNKDSSADMGIGYCRQLMWDAPRGRVFVRAEGSAMVFEPSTGMLRRASELGFAVTSLGGLLGIYPDGSLLVIEPGAVLKRLTPDGRAAVVLQNSPCSDCVGQVDQAGTVFLLDRTFGGVYRIKQGSGTAERLAGPDGYQSTEPGERPSWRDAIDLRIWGPDQLLVTTQTEVTVLDVPSGVDCGCSPVSTTAQARARALQTRRTAAAMDGDAMPRALSHGAAGGAGRKQ